MTVEPGLGGQKLIPETIDKVKALKEYIDKNTYLLDTPGFQNMDIYEIESKDLENYFIEFKSCIKN